MGHPGSIVQHMLDGADRLGCGAKGVATSKGRESRRVASKGVTHTYLPGGRVNKRREGKEIKAEPKVVSKKTKMTKMKAQKAKMKGNEGPI